MAYDLELEIKEVLEKIKFVERYKSLSEKFSDRTNTFENYENEKAIYEKTPWHCALHGIDASIYTFNCFCCRWTQPS